MIKEKPREINIFYDVDNQVLHFSNRYREALEKLQPLIYNLDNYIMLYRDTDFNKNVNKLKFKDTHKNEIFNIFNSYKEIFNNNDVKTTFMIYGYWFSDIVCKYFNLYFNDKISEKYAYCNSVVYGHRKCNKCNIDNYIQINSRMDLESLIKYNYPCYIVFNKNKEYFCDECDYLENIRIIKTGNKDDKRYTRALRLIPYNEYLQTEHWKRVRERILRQSGYKCQSCGSLCNLNVHHNTYENRGHEKDEDLVVLCFDCHQKFHNTNNIYDD